MSRKPPLTALQVFTIAARHGSFLAAANDLHVTPGAVSRQIKTLENNLGSLLFVRLTRRVELTPAGQQLFNLLLPAMNMIDEAWRQVSGAGHSATLRLECPPTFAMHWLIPRLAAYRKEHPDVDVVLTTTQGPIDRATSSHLVIRRCPSQFSGLAGHPFMDEYSLPVCSPDYLRQQKFSGPDSVACATRIEIRSRPDLWPKWFAQHGLPPGGMGERLEFDNTILSIQAAAQGLGVAFVPCLFLDTYLASGSLVALPGFPPVLTGAYHWLNPRPRLSKNAEEFVAWLAVAGIAEDKPADGISNP